MRSSSLGGLRGSGSYKQKFIAFEEMCPQVADITPQEMDAHDAKQYPSYYRTQRHLSATGAST